MTQLRLGVCMADSTSATATVYIASYVHELNCSYVMVYTSCNLPQIFKPQIFVPLWRQDDGVIVVDQNFLVRREIPQGDQAHHSSKSEDTKKE